MEKIQTRKNGTNLAIQAHLLPEKEMRAAGFTDYHNPTWYFCRGVHKNVTLNVTIPKKNPQDLAIEVLDENFLQPYDYQSILERDSTHSIALAINEKVEEWMDFLQERGILSGHHIGAYI